MSKELIKMDAGFERSKRPAGAAQPFAAVLVLSALSAGCSQQRAGIPFGHWQGRGTFVYCTWKESEEATQPAAPKAYQRDYDTILSIRPAKLDGQDVVELEIVSKRGRFDEDDDQDQTHLLFAVEKVKELSDSTALYRTVAFRYDPKPDDLLSRDQGDQEVSATCMTSGGACIFRITYDDDFSDVFRFQGNRLEKSGILHDRHGGLIHWSEHLTRTGPPKPR